VTGASKRSSVLSSQGSGGANNTGNNRSSNTSNTAPRQSKFAFKSFRSNNSSMTLSSADGSNSKLIRSLDGVIYDLISVYPEGASIKDENDYVPFAQTIATWIEGNAGNI